MLAPGSVLGNYCIMRALGTGGMGEVYRARHVVLGRDVALKTLPPDRVHDPERTRRFIKEARAASALNHPNIVVLYDIDKVGDCQFIAMEYVDGKTLRDLIGDAGLPVEKAVRYARSIADALAAAHAAGIIHRDVKPANVMVSRSNSVKVLDFGLAKLFEVEHDALGSTRTLLAEESDFTPRGEICGTLAYMSPEQAEGRHVDHRTDIFSFGIVFYQMLTGRFPFWGPTSAAIREAILAIQPAPVSALRPGVPRELQDLVEICLRKDPEQRFQSMRDVVHVLEIIERNADRRVPALNRPKSKSRQKRMFGAAACVVLAMVGAWFWMNREETGKRGPVLRRLTWDASLSEAPTLSPEGNWVAFASDRDRRGNLNIWIQGIRTGELKTLTEDPADDTEPCFSPDGSRIVFHSDRMGGGIYTVPSLVGGTERLLARNGRRPRYSPDGQQIVYWVGDRQGRLPTGRLFLIPANGGQSRALRADFANAHDPVWTPDGKHILFEGSRMADMSDVDWWVTPVDDGPPVRTGAAEIASKAGLISYPPGGWRNGKVVFSARTENTRSVYELPISLRTWKASGVPERLTFGTAADGEPFPTADGRIAFQSSNSTINLWAAPMARDGAVGEEIHRITEGGPYHWAPSASADGRRVAYSVGRLKTRDIWLEDVTRGQQSVFLATPSDECSPVISRDGSRVAYSICGSNTKPIHIAGVSEQLEAIDAERICENCGEPNDWSADGTRILYVAGSPNVIGVLDVASRKHSVVLQSPHGVDQPRFSPDGKWIALSEQIDGGRTRIVIIPATGGSPAIPITDARGWDNRPVWAPDGNAVLFQSPRDSFMCLWRQLLDPATKQPQGAPISVRHFHSARTSLSGMNVTLSGMWASRQQLIFNLYEGTGNIWLFEDHTSTNGTVRAAVPGTIVHCHGCSNRL